MYNIIALLFYTSKTIHSLLYKRWWIWWIKRIKQKRKIKKMSDEKKWWWMLSFWNKMKKKIFDDRVLM
jgi:hypothetical protein